MTRPAYLRRSIRRRWRSWLRRYIAKLMREAVEGNVEGLRGAIVREMGE